MKIIKKLDKLKKYAPDSKWGRRSLSILLGIIFVIPSTVLYPYFYRDISGVAAYDQILGSFPAYFQAFFAFIILAPVAVTYINLLLKRWRAKEFESKGDKYFCIIVTPFLWIPLVLVVFLLVVGLFESSTLRAKPLQ
ncbi:MAG: hypothetical protein WD335_03690 [Candidatus Paceibacterota bacterium]